MPKIRVVKSKEEAEKVPATEPVDFDLSEKPPVEIVAPGPQGKDETIVPVEPAHKAVEPLPKEPVEAAPDLLKQLETLKKAETENKRKLEEAERARAEAEQRAQRHQTEMREVRQTAAEAQLDSVVNAISAVQADADTAQGRYAAAMAQQDYVGAAEAQRVMSRSESRLAQLETQKEQLENKKEESAPSPVTGATKVDQVLNSMPGLSTQERTWLRDHPDAVLTPVNLQRLEVAYRDATDRGIARNSDEYFRFFADRLGYKDEAVEPEEEPVEEEEVTTPAPKRYSAPPSRQSVSPAGARDTSTRITLLPEHRAAAKWSGVDENEYAKGLMRLRALKQDGFYND